VSAADNADNTPDNPVAAEPERDRRHKAEGDLGLMLCEHMWDKTRPLRLGGEAWEVAHYEDVPGYDDGDAVLLRRKADGKVFEADIDVTLREVEKPATGGPR
jgi:hypothetical protein